MPHCQQTGTISFEPQSTWSFRYIRWPLRRICSIITADLGLGRRRRMRREMLLRQQLVTLATSIRRRHERARAGQPSWARVLGLHSSGGSFLRDNYGQALHSEGHGSCGLDNICQTRTPGLRILQQNTGELRALDAPSEVVVAVCDRRHSQHRQGRRFGRGRCDLVVYIVRTMYRSKRSRLSIQRSVLSVGLCCASKSKKETADADVRPQSNVVVSVCSRIN